jgi:carboxylate-amine ligase
MMRECETLLAGHVKPEFLRSQIEVNTATCGTIQEAAADLIRMRRTLAGVASRYGLAPIAASTHPFASWHQQRHTDKERYNAIERDLQALGRRLVICGMHVHVGISDPDLRIDLMGQAAYFLPHLLALSTSSPFWEGEDTGLKSYRLAIFDEIPRTGLPESFDSYGEFERHLGVLVRAGLIEDGSKIWWDLRPSVRFPTLEMRITDVCTRVDDAICIAAIYRCLLRMLYRLRRGNQRWRLYAAMLVNENRWRAQRYGMDAGLVDFGKGRIVPYPELLEEMLTLLRPDAEFFGCVREIEHARTIVARGTSAHRQVALYESAVAAGRPVQEALSAVVDMLIDETVLGPSAAV